MGNIQIHKNNNIQLVLKSEPGISHQVNLSQINNSVNSNKIISSNSFNNRKVNISSGNGNEVMVCKICYDKGTDDMPLIYPCTCQGSMKYIHVKCLKKWLGDKDITKEKPFCEICKHEYKINLIYEYFFSEKKCCLMMKTLIMVFVVASIVLTLLIVLIMGILGSTGEFTEGRMKQFKSIMIGIAILILILVLLTYFRDCKQNYYDKTVIDWDIGEFEKSIISVI